MIKIIKTIKDIEDNKTLELFNDLKYIRKQGYLTKEQLIKILKWKSPRPLKYYESNTETEIIEITKQSFKTQNEKLKIHILSALSGVKYPGASAILMFYEPANYPVIDIRVWQQLYNSKFLNNNPKGQNFTLNQWIDYLTIIRNIASELKISARQVEKRIFDYDRNTRKTKLYL